MDLWLSDFPAPYPLSRLTGLHYVWSKRGSILCLFPPLLPTLGHYRQNYPIWDSIWLLKSCLWSEEPTNPSKSQHLPLLAFAWDYSQRINVLYPYQSMPPINTYLWKHCPVLCGEVGPLPLLLTLHPNGATISELHAPTGHGNGHIAQDDKVMSQRGGGIIQIGQSWALYMYTVPSLTTLKYHVNTLILDRN